MVLPLTLAARSATPHIRTTQSRTKQMARIVLIAENISPPDVAVIAPAEGLQFCRGRGNSKRGTLLRVKGNARRCAEEVWMKSSPAGLWPLLRNVLGVVDRHDRPLLGNAVHRAQQIFNHILELALALDHRAHALQLLGLLHALDERYCVALGYMIEIQALGCFRLDAHLIDRYSQQIGNPRTHFRR